MYGLLGRVLRVRIVLLFILFGFQFLETVHLTPALQPGADFVCWSALAVGVCVYKYGFSAAVPNRAEVRNLYLWLIRIGVVIAAWSQSHFVPGSVWPALTVTIAVARVFQSRNALPPESKESSTSVVAWAIRIAAAIFAIVTLTSGAQVSIVTMGLLFLAAQALIYVSLDFIVSEQAEPLTLPDVSALAIDVALFALPPLALLSVFRLWYSENPSLGGFGTCVMAALGILKALRLSIIALMHGGPPWDVVATAGTFASSVLALMRDNGSPLWLLSCGLTSAISIAQTVDALAPKRYKGINLLYLLLLVPLGMMIAYHSAQPSELWKFVDSRRTLPVNRHPVEILSEFYEGQLEQMLSRQSKTVDEAISTYRLRYQRDPPPGFEAWYQYAKSHGALIIDDYDSIEDSLRPLRAFPGEELRGAASSAAASLGGRTWHCSVHDGSFQQEGCDWMGTELAEILVDIHDPLPSLPIILNALDEPRVLPSSDPHTDVKWHDASKRPSYERITQNCDPTSSPPKDWHGADQLWNHPALPFVWSPEEAKDVCLHPEYEHMHGFLQSPATLLWTETTVPIFSPAKFSTFADILYPPPFYMGTYDSAKYQEKEDPEWEQKRPQLYWTGSTTGSHAAGDDWRTHHRQRFVTRVNQLANRSATFLNEDAPGQWRMFESSDIFSQLYAAKFTAVIQCNADQCAQEKEFFHPASREGGSAGFQYRFIFDLDGNSFSGRYYTLLQSRSVVLKQTLFKEWHDERLIPWVHYVPISLDMGELPEVMRYLALTRDGSERARKIADAGREWVKKALRKEDAGVYMYRLLLELGQLMRE